MWYAGASQSNGAAYLLCFVLGALALVSVIHAWANLRGLAVTIESIPSVFAGDETVVPFAVSSRRTRAHFSLQIFAGRGKTPAHIAEVGPDYSAHGILHFTALQRGCFHELPLRMMSQFPLGFFTASQRVVLARTYYVYPAPSGAAPLPRALAPIRQPRDGTRVAGDDFGGVRSWQPGESQRHIDWKAAARGQPLLTKQWTGEADEILRLDWNTLAALDMEARLSQIARWIILAEHSTADYALHLPGETIPAGHGKPHFHRCLRALTMFDGSKTESPP
jgi:uncharacterized protein (DUF58 family)